MRHVYALIIAAPLVQLACGSSQPTAATPDATAPTGAGDAPATSDASEPAAIPAKFDDMNHKERLKLMQSVVVPEMTTVFKSHDAEAFAEVNCATCHGPGAGRGDFDMPSAALPKLPAKGAFDALKAKDGEMVEFMMTEVVPKMASILGDEPFDPSTGKGFGCYDCHQSE